MNLKEKIAFGAVIAFALSSGGFALAQSNNVSSDQVIYGCVTGINGNIVKVSNAPHLCPSNTSPIYWNVAGLAGATCPQGLQGLTGTTGPQGLQGLTGTTGPQGLQGLTGATGPQGLVGPRGDKGDSAPITYAVTSSGQKYPLFSGPFGGSFVNIGGYLYLVDIYRGNAPQLTGEYSWNGGFGYKSSDCSGSPFYLAATEEYIIPKVAYEDPTLGHWNNPDLSDLFSFEKTNSVKVSDINSWYRVGVGCYNNSDPIWNNWGLSVVYRATNISRPQITDFTW